MNLIGNAIKFTERGTIRVEVAALEGDRLRFSVRDQGIGIAPEHMELIFDKFTQADASVSRRYGGTGLGLSISRRLVGLMGGELRVESRVGEGSTFWFEIDLPILSPQAGGDAGREVGKPRSTEPPRPPAAASILLVEDSEDNRMLIRTYLKGSGHRLDIAGDGREGVERVRGGHYDLVLMDVQMPVMDGYQATRAIRRWEQEQEQGRARLPILALTAHALQGDDQETLAAGCDAHLTKPIKKGRLLEAIARHLG